MRLAAVLVSLLAAGCTVDDLDLTGRECPCVDGWVCDATRNVCVEATGTDAGRADAGPGADAGRDAGVGTDAGRTDGGGLDAGRMDAGGMDAGPPPMDAGHDAGRPDAGHDAGPPAPPSLCGTTHASRAFCDSFESGDTSAWDYTDSDSGGSITAVRSPVYRGGYAMRYESPRGAEWSVSATQPWGDSGPVIPDIWLRAYYYFPSAHPPNIELMQIGDDDWYQTAVGAAWGSSLANWHTHDYMGDAWHDTPTTVPLDTWVCIEMHVSTDATNGGVELFWDGVEMDSNLTLDGSAEPMNRIDAIYVGLVYSESADPDQVVFVDEVVADTTRIGCDP